MQIGVLSHTVCLLRNQSLNMQLHTEQNTENRQVAQAASDTHSGVQDNHMEGDKHRTILEIRADLVLKEYHSLLSPVLAYRSVDVIRGVEDYRNVMINLYSAHVTVRFCVYRMRWLHKELEYMACHGVKCVNVFNHVVSKYKTSSTYASTVGWALCRVLD